MNPDTNDFDRLRKLLALKRYELPPPRYFNEFSGRVMARLAEPQLRKASALTWWHRLGFDFDLGPAMMCGVGIVICGLLSFGIIEAMQIAEPDSGAAPANSFAIGSPTTPSIAGLGSLASVETVNATPFTSQSASPFNQFHLGVTPVAFNGFGLGGN